MNSLNISQGTPITTRDNDTRFSQEITGYAEKLNIPPNQLVASLLGKDESFVKRIKDTALQLDLFTEVLSTTKYHAQVSLDRSGGLHIIDGIDSGGAGPIIPLER